MSRRMPRLTIWPTLPAAPPPERRFVPSRWPNSLFRHLGAGVREAADAPMDIALTRRQHQILRLIQEGMSNKEIAQRLSLGTSTVKNHVHSLLSRLQVGCRAEAAARLDRPVANHGDRGRNLTHFGV